MFRPEGARSFAPNLLDLRPDYRERANISRWGMEPEGQPIPTGPQYRGALWHGIFSVFKEAPVLVVLVPVTANHILYDTTWYVGAASEETVSQSPDALLAYADVAEHPMPTLFTAIQMLRSFTPLEHFPEPDKILS